MTTVSKGNSKRLLSRRATMWPPTLYLVVFFAIPIVAMAIVSFQFAGEHRGLGAIIGQDAGGASLNFTTEAYRRFAADGVYFQLIFKSLAYALVTTLLCAALAYPPALMIARAPKRWRDRLLLLAILPLWICILIRVYPCMMILGPRAGPDAVSNAVLGSLAVIVCLVYAHLPLMIWPLAANLRTHDPLLLDAAQDCGADAARRFWRITFPLSSPGLYVGAALVFIPAFGAFVIPDLLGGPQGWMIGNLIGQQFLIAHDWAWGSVLALIVTIVAVAVAALALMLAQRRRYK
jgi:spermidine/putrescine transport system permease protein